jgi:hypothetical protein
MMILFGSWSEFSFLLANQFGGAVINFPQSFKFARFDLKRFVLELNRHLHELGLFLNPRNGEIVVVDRLLLLVDVGALQFDFLVFSIDRVLESLEGSHDVVKFLLFPSEIDFGGALLLRRWVFQTFELFRCMGDLLVGVFDAVGQFLDELVFGDDQLFSTRVYCWL